MLSPRAPEDCSCTFSLPSSSPDRSYSSVVSEYINAPDFTIVADQRIVYSRLLLPGPAAAMPLEKDLEGAIFVYANEKLVYAEWLDYKLPLSV